MEGIKILCPTGHLGFTPIEKGSLYEGMKHKPDFLIADSGSCDIGPYPLGADDAASPEEWQRHDLEVMLLESRKLGVPMIIGSASDTGADRGVTQYIRLIKEIAREHKLPRFRLGYIYSEQDKTDLAGRMKNGLRIEGLSGRADLTPADLEATDHVVAVMGPEPIIKVLDMGAEVVICGRSTDSSIFAAPLLRGGIPENIAWYAGKVLECASFACEPFMGKESILGTINQSEVFVEPMHPGQRATIASIAGHAMYERENPFHQREPGGLLDMTDCLYEQYSERVTRITGPRFIRDEVYKVKLEGSGRVGERALSIVGIRDPYTIAHIDQVIAWAKGKVEERYGEIGPNFQLYYHVYGKDGVMGEWEPHKEITGHEICVVVEAVAESFALAKVVCNSGARNMFYARLPEVRGTAGTAALMMDEILQGHTGYRWTINHALPVKDPLELFTIGLQEMGG